MPCITKISSQKRRKKVNVFLNEKFAFSVDLETLVKYNLQVGQTLSQEEIEEIIKEGEFQKVYDRVLKFLSYRPRSEKEVGDYLFKKGVGGETKKLVIEKLKKQNLLDDQEFALWWIDQRITFKLSGERLLRSELIKKGIGKEIIDEVLAKKMSESLERKLALKAAQKKLATYQKLPPLEFRQKMSAFLARRGFSWEIIKEIINQLTSNLASKS